MMAEAWTFDLSGARLCLDFANTLESRRGAEPRERLTVYGDLVGWAGQAGLIGKDEAEALRAVAAKRPQEAERALATARRLREATFAIFSSVADGEPAPEAALAALNAALPDALSALRLNPAGQAFEWSWSLEERGLERILPPVVRDAAELLTSVELTRVRECESDTCAWLFLDQSRNRTRRWCDMGVCGNRAKARRHYARRKRASGTGGSG